MVTEGRVTGKFNFCSGDSVPLSRLIDGLAAASGIAVEVEHRPESANRGDIDEFAGSPERLEAATGWRPQIGLDRSLAEMLASRREAAAAD
jgi:GDP-4-dehydro-6-deoxy-D-mannose reductase